jgi:hypothetical protein
LFNNYCTYREQHYGNTEIEGDIIIDGQVTGPVFGDDMTWADPDTPAGRLEKEWKEHFEIDKKVLEVYQKYGIF